MTKFQILKEVLTASIRKNGDKPLTLSHLLNILNTVDKIEEKIEVEDDASGFDPFWD